MLVHTPEARQTIKAYIKQASEAMLIKKRQEEEVKDILNTLKEQFDISPKLARKVIDSKLKGNVQEVKAENTDFEDLYELAK